MATSGEIQWPPMGSFPWPPSHCGSRRCPRPYLWFGTPPALSTAAEQSVALIEEEQSPVGERSGMSPEGQLDADAQPNMSLLARRSSQRAPECQ